MADELTLRVFISFDDGDRDLMNELVEFLYDRDMNPIMINLRSWTRRNSTKIGTLPIDILADVFVPIISHRYVENTWLMRELQALALLKGDWICPLYMDGLTSVPDMRLQNGAALGEHEERFNALAEHLDAFQRRLINEQQSRKVFVVHGTDRYNKRGDVARYLESLGFDAVILSERHSSGLKTVVEKLEEQGNVGFAVVIMTEDDVGGRDETDLEKRSRQNVLFEFGYFVGRFTREKVFLLKDGEPKIPSDLEGLEWHLVTGDWKTRLRGALDHHFTIDGSIKER